MTRSAGPQTTQVEKMGSVRLRRLRLLCSEISDPGPLGPTRVYAREIEVPITDEGCRKYLAAILEFAASRGVRALWTEK